MMELRESVNNNLDHVLISKERDKIKKLIFILMESPFYMTLSIKERYQLLKKLVQSYPSFFENPN